MWFTHQRGRNLPWGVGFVETPTPSKDVFTETQFVYCDFYVWLTLRGKAQLLHGRVSWTLDQVSAPSPRAVSCDRDVLWLMWIQSNKKNEQYNLNGKMRKKDCDVFACSRCIPSASINVALLPITKVYQDKHWTEIICLKATVERSGCKEKKEQAAFPMTFMNLRYMYIFS